MKQRLVVCIGNKGYPASLEKRKIYVALRDARVMVASCVVTSY